ncbi:Zinc finger C3HC4 RING-type [Arabidopsis suecica]|uniref:RBR-type E3 ubiquitin transferase n=1 Tax=Arabidopsis suecica TaxID=45249 RepID=A0A8T2G1B9_ARASU|nr:Zinc finger C3HC4 RING-type [Arabidopsis suecica]
MALIRGLRESFDLGIRQVVVYCDDQLLYQYIVGRGKIKKKVVHLVDEFQLLLEEMTYTDADLIALNDVNFAFKLAREAIVSRDDVKAEICSICFEETEGERMFFTTEKCVHRHCFPCVKQYVEVKLLSGTVPTCLDDGCKFKLTLESCSKVLTLELIEMWKQKMKEDSIPTAERIYCPYPNCSMLMSKTELSSESNLSNDRSCVKCCGLFCIDCKVPSHSDLSCSEYKKLHHDPLVDELKLKSLAKDKKWRQCKMCRHMIELSHACNHMTCRCGYQFCYQCEVEWKNDQKTCSSGCLLTGHGYYDDYDYNEPEYDFEVDTCNYYSDEEAMTRREMIRMWNTEQFFSEEENADGNDDNWDDYNNYGGLTVFWRL